jgi:hypothetical protein
MVRPGFAACTWSDLGISVRLQPQRKSEAGVGQRSSLRECYPRLAFRSNSPTGEKYSPGGNA